MRRRETRISDRRLAAGLLVAAAALPAVAQSPDAPAPPGDAAAFRVENLAAGIYLFRPQHSSLDHANSVVVDRDDGLLVVEAQPTVRAARDLLAAIALRTTEPVRYLVMTHPHAAAAGGESAFPATTLRIASVGFRDAMADPSFDFLADLRTDDEEPEEVDPAAVPPRANATLVLFSRTRLEDPHNPLILLPLPHAHSPGDMLVYQPEAGIVVAGGIPFPDGNPYAVGSRIGAWLSQINHLISMSPNKVAALRGPPLDTDALKRQRDGLSWLRGTVDAAFVEGIEADDIPAYIREQPRLSEYFRTSARPSHLEGLIAQVIEEARERRRRMGLE